MLNGNLMELTSRASELAKRLDGLTKILDRERAAYERKTSAQRAEHGQISAELAIVVKQISAATAGPDLGGPTFDKTSVLEALRESPESSAGGIRNSLNAPSSDTDAINKALAALHREGKVRTVEGARGRYKRYVAVS